MNNTFRNSHRVIFICLLVNLLFIYSYQAYNMICDWNNHEIACILDKDIDSEKESSEEEKAESSDYYIVHIDTIYQQKVKQRLSVLHLENFKNLIFPPFSPPPELA